MVCVSVRYFGWITAEKQLNPAVSRHAGFLEFGGWFKRDQVKIQIYFASTNTTITRADGSCTTQLEKNQCWKKTIAAGCTCM